MMAILIAVGLANLVVCPALMHNDNKNDTKHGDDSHLTSKRN